MSTPPAGAGKAAFFETWEEIDAKRFERLREKCPNRTQLDQCRVNYSGCTRANCGLWHLVEFIRRGQMGGL